MASSKGKEKVKEEPSSNYNGTLGYNGGSSTEFIPLPPGYKFDPKDEELVVFYLRPKVNKQRLPPNKMHEVQIYDSQTAEGYNPEQLTASYEPQGEGVWYFFTSRYQKYPNGSRPNRSSGCGFWKASGADEHIVSNGVVVGYKRSLVFNIRKRPFAQKTNWLMQEFWLNYDQTNKPQRDKARKSKIDKLDEWVLCKIRYNKGNKQENDGTNQEPKKRKSEPSTTNPTPENRPLPDCSVTPMPPQFYDHHNQICDPPVMDHPATNGIWIASQTNDTNCGASSTNYSLEDVKVNDYNLITKRSQFVGNPSHDTHWSGMTGMPSTLHGFYGYNEFCDPPIMDDPTECAILDCFMSSQPNTYTECGASSINPTLEDVKVMPLQLVDLDAHWSSVPSTSGEFYGNNLVYNPSIMDDLTGGAWFGPQFNNNTIFEIGSTSSFMENYDTNTCNMQQGLKFDNGLLKDSTDMFDISFP